MVRNSNVFRTFIAISNFPILIRNWNSAVNSPGNEICFPLEKEEGTRRFLQWKVWFCHILEQIRPKFASEKNMCGNEEKKIANGSAEPGNFRFRNYLVFCFHLLIVLVRSVTTTSYVLPYCIHTRTHIRTHAYILSHMFAYSHIMITAALHCCANVCVCIGDSSKLLYVFASSNGRNF